MSDQARAAAALFDPDRLRLAREALGLTKAALAETVELTPAAISQFEKASNGPSVATIARLAWALEVSPAFFEARPRPVPLPTSEEAFFRSVRATSRLQRREASARAVLLAEIAAVLEIDVELPALRLPPAAGFDELTTDEEIIRLAAQLREHLKLGDAPVPHLVRLLEAHGVLVTKLPAEDGRVSAFSQWFGTRPVVVLQNGNTDRLRFDLGHELGHLVMHDEPDAGNAIFERQANVFSAAFLMPAHQLEPVLPARFNLRALVALKRTWGVSIHALLYRARELGRMSDASYRNAMIKMSAAYGRKHEPHPLPDTERPVLLMRAAEMAYGNDPIRALADATHIPESRLHEMLDIAPPRQQLDAEALLGDLDARRAARER